MGDRDSHDEAAAARVQRVRGYRVRAERDPGVAAEIDRLARGVRRRSDAEDAAAEAWDAVVPDAFRGSAVFVGAKRGVVTIKAADAGVRYKLEAWIRGGGGATFAGVAKTAVSKVRVTV